MSVKKGRKGGGNETPRCLGGDQARSARKMAHGHNECWTLQWDMQKYDPVAFTGVFDIASLILFGTQGIPLRLHICLQRLMACLTNDEVSRITKQFDWSWEEFCRGCKILNKDDSLRSSWTYASVTDETMILGHFLKYKPTQGVATKFLRDIAIQKKEENPYLHMVAPTSESGLQTYFLQNNAKPVLAPPSVPVPVMPVTSSTQLSLPGASASLVDSSPSTQIVPTHNQRPQTNTSCLASVLLRPVQNGPVQVQPNESHMSMVQATATVTSPSFNFNINPPVPSIPPIPQTPVTAPAKRKLQPKPAPVPVSVPSEIATMTSPPGIPTAVFSAMPNGHLPKLEFLPSPPDTPQSNKKAPTKRVNCEHCNKSFCDKGALKIHYSAVHLKEMHRCSVKGCNMMFSSRRSRNRHSSNPNPRLHSNLFQPRRGGVLAEDGTELPQPNEGTEAMAMNIHIDSDSEGDGESRSDDEGEVRGLKRERSEDSLSSQGKLVIASEDSQMSGMEAQPGPSKERRESGDGIVADRLRYTSPPYEEALDFSMKNKEPVDASKNTRCSSEQPTSLKPSQSPSNVTFPEWEDETGSLKDEPTSDSPSTSTPMRFTERPRVPSDPSDPCKCVDCGKLFKNHFTVRTHYQNVHLKIMHVCTVPGCSAKFPSVRSRDRHSANDNLHQKSGASHFVPDAVQPVPESLPLPLTFAPILPQYLPS